MIAVALNIAALIVIFDALHSGIKARRTNGLSTTRPRSFNTRIYYVISFLLSVVAILFSIVLVKNSAGLSASFALWAVLVPNITFVFWPVCLRVRTIEFSVAGFKYGIVSFILVLLSLSYIVAYSIGCDSAKGACIPIF